MAWYSKENGISGSDSWRCSNFNFSNRKTYLLNIQDVRNTSPVEIFSPPISDTIIRQTNGSHCSQSPVRRGHRPTVVPENPHTLAYAVGPDGRAWAYVSDRVSVLRVPISLPTAPSRAWRTDRKRRAPFRWTALCSVPCGRGWRHCSG